MQANKSKIVTNYPSWHSYKYLFYNWPSLATLKPISCCLFNGFINAFAEFTNKNKDSTRLWYWSNGPCVGSSLPSHWWLDTGWLETATAIGATYLSLPAPPAGKPWRGEIPSPAHAAARSGRGKMIRCSPADATYPVLVFPAGERDKERSSTQAGLNAGISTSFPPPWLTQPCTLSI